MMEILQENVELSAENKQRLKIYAAEQNESMKDLLLSEARQIIDMNAYVPAVDRAEDYTTLIINISDEFKSEIKSFCNQKGVRIRDFWVECFNRIIEGEDEVKY